MLIINSVRDISDAIIANGVLSDLWAAGLSQLGVEVIREMDHPAYGTNWEEWIYEHEEEIRAKVARRGGHNE